MRVFCHRIVVLGLFLGLMGGCASGVKSGVGGEGISGRRVPMRPARRPASVVAEEPRVDWAYGMYHWPDPWVPLVVYNASGLLFFNANGEIYRTYAWLQAHQDGVEQEEAERSGLLVLDVMRDGLPSLVAVGDPTLFLGSNADVQSVQPQGCSVRVGVDAASGKRRLECGGEGDEVVRPLENFATKPHGAHAVDESFLFDFSGDGQVYEFARLHEGGLSVISGTDGVIAEISTKTPVESMMAVDLDGDGAEELVVLTGDEVLIMRGSEPRLLRWPTDTRRYARVVVTEATEVVGSVLAREDVRGLVGSLGACFEDELGLLYDKPDAVVQVSLVGHAGDEDEASGDEREVQYSVVRGYLYDEQLACLGRVLDAYRVPLAEERAQNQLRFRMRVNWRDVLASDVVVEEAMDGVRGAVDVAMVGELLKDREDEVVDVSVCADLVMDVEGWGQITDDEEVARLVAFLGSGGEDGEMYRHPAFGRAVTDGGALVPPVEMVDVGMRCAADFDGDGTGDVLVKFEWSSTLDAAEMCNPDLELGEVPCYRHRLQVLLSPGSDWQVLAVMGDHFIGMMHDRYTVFGDDYQYLVGGGAAVKVTFTNRDARTGCFFGSSALMTYEDGQFVRVLGTKSQRTPCFPDMDQRLVEAPGDLRCPGVHQLENIEGYKRAGFVEIYDHERGVDFRCFRLSGTLVDPSEHSEK